MKQVIKCIIFIVLFCIFLNCTFSILWLNETSISEFYYEPKNSLDVIYIGGSNVYAHFNSTLAYNKYGFTTGLISSDSQPAIFAKYFIKEAEKYQNPDLYIIDLVNFIFDDEALEEGSVRKCADSMKFSLNRIDALNKVLPYLNVAMNILIIILVFLSIIICGKS